MPEFRTKRVYDAPSGSDGYRVLIDRLWPRGLSKEKARLDQWAKDLAPSSELRRWFDHDPKKYAQFTKKYRAELDNNPRLVDYKTTWQNHAVVTLLYGAKDREHNEVMVLHDYL